ncbi:MMPL family transporter [Mesorhizobium sp. BAC0120]|uniref:hopanoid transporter HpnN n=1 Tax=Mesorhizobium sp. BAC0120 TaxID=3090670 RepID=UPI00298BEA8C|nr:MMPL family transporter [Mesorhizobium sp. BAC0120]MDW6026157.1 MMPL family transporter [Mesorhizobium sp. BAC0120]
MLTSFFVGLFGFCTRHPWPVVAAGLLVAVASGIYASRHFAINTDVGTLFSRDPDWRKRELAFEEAFHPSERLLVVVEAPTPELTSQATTALAAALSENKGSVGEVSIIGGGPFFVRNGLLFQSTQELEQTVSQLKQGEPLISDLAKDPSLRGLVTALGDGLQAIQSGDLSISDDFTRVFDLASNTLEDVLAGRPASFSWRVATQGRAPQPSELRGFIDVRPHLDYGAIEPGQAATTAVRELAAAVLPQYQADARLTGPVAMTDEEFATIKENAVRNGIVTAIVVLIILWLALRSGRLIFPVLINLAIGLAITAAVGLKMVGSLNVISIYFAILYVGIGVDFGIQLSVRYRAERHEFNDLRTALLRTARFAGVPLTLAAAATAAGFLSFLPTDYRGVSELGLIAGVGMLIALATSISLLPALICLLSPPGEPKPLSLSFLAPIDEFLERRRIPIVIGTALVVIGGLPLLYYLRFDSDPINLRNPRTESIATYLDLSRDPDSNVNVIEVLAPSIADARTIAARVSKLPEVSHAMTVESLIPDRQQEKMPLIGEAAKTLQAAFDPRNASAPPTDAENVDALKQGASWLAAAAAGQSGAGAMAANRMAQALTRLASESQDVRKRAESAFVSPLKLTLSELQASLEAQPITVESLPPELRDAWVTPDGQARVTIVPKDNQNDSEAMQRFARAVLAAEPSATSGPISILKAGDTVLRAFIEAGLWAVLSIAILLWIVLRRFGDVLLTLIPLILAGVVTLEACVLIDLPLNFANIIALPLLLGVGVAFKIYYVMAWRAGQTQLLQTSLTRAVFFSALTTATAFASLWFSSHPGTSSMGKLLALSLLCTLFAAVVFQPLLMGKPRELASD